MMPSTRKRLAQIYDQRGSMGSRSRRTKAHSPIAFSCIDLKEAEEIKSILRVDDLHSTIQKGPKQGEGCVVSVAKKRDVIFTCISVFEFLKDTDKRKKMANNWRELGWCICDHV